MVSYSDAARAIETHHLLAVVVNLQHSACAVPAARAVSALVLYGHAVTHLQCMEWLGGSVVTGEELYITFGEGSLALLCGVQPLWMDVQRGGRESGCAGHGQTADEWETR